MSEDGKNGNRPVRRKDQARATRRRIIDAALARFTSEGYAAATLDSIAADAGVSVQTVYFHFGSKRNVLKEGVDVLAVGDDLPIPLLERPWMQELHATPDPYRALQLWMDASRKIYERIAPLMRIIRDAAGADPEMAAQWDTNQQQRVVAHRALAEALDAKNGLRDGIGVDEATDVLYSLMSPEMYGLLVGDRNWTATRWQAYVTRLAAIAVLHPPDTADNVGFSPP
ncbi:TetR/AcrR family transcriptional regulator [Ilumatobacter nonamiensis]|uniref:TetR/AcrR family transcriptional regulator n=1 Tax=Ilumatobacter nonamiensis TaxID=467093 RepID=UPI000347BC03|nr:TetR/AcrR family transcriptional regulator [Ilumatobacter nonamiensis]